VTLQQLKDFIYERKKNVWMDVIDTMLIVAPVSEKSIDNGVEWSIP